MATNTELSMTQFVNDWIDSIQDSILQIHEQASRDANTNDLILLENSNGSIRRPYETLRPILWRLLVVSKIELPKIPGGPPKVFIRDVHRLDRRDFIEYSIDNAYFHNHTSHLPFYSLTTLLTPNTTIHLRPSLRLLRDTFYAAICAYEYCNEGVISLSRSIARELGVEPAIRDLQGSYKALCIFCMGEDLFEKQESLAMFEITDPGGREAMVDHCLEINWRRMQLGYGPLRMDMMHDLLWKERLAKEDSKKSNTFSRPVNWFVRHLGLDLGLRCPICKEEFEETEKVTMLHCGHIFHRRCIAACLEPMARGCVFECDGVVRLE